VAVATATEAYPAGASYRARPGRVLHRLFEPVDVASLVAFRVMFGAVAVWEVYRYFDYGWIEAYFVEPVFHFTYFGFDWIRPLPAPGMRLLFLTIGALGAAIAIGAWYRLSAALFFVAFTYVFLIEATRYLNHFYLIALLGLLLTVVPAHRRLSVDAWRTGRRSETAPAWSLWLLRAQIGIVYFFGGIAKLNADWLRGEPMRTWLAERTDFPVLGRFFDQEWMVYATSYGALLFDLLVVPALLWRRTRVAALLCAVAFNWMNNELFSIGVFPYLAMAGALLFCDPSWPRTLLARVVPARAALPPPLGEDSGLPTRRKLGIALLVCYLGVQVLVPLRHHLYPGPPSWTENGHQFAWHMKLRDKVGVAAFVAYDPDTGDHWTVDPGDVLEPWQYHKMAVRPELLRQFSHHIAHEFRAQGRDVQVFAHAWASLNGRDYRRLVDHTVDLAAEPPRLTPQRWILPLDARS
jgi:vitamin K-dependent gamma-carboxylase